MSIRTVLAATDFSEFSETAARTAHSVALRQNAKLVLYHVSELNELLLGGPDGPAYLPSDMWARLWDRESSNIEESLGALRDKLSRPGSDLEIETAYDRGDPVTKILAAAQEHHADLIVLGAHGASGSLRYLFGSVTARLSRESRTPILVTRPGESAVTAELGTFSKPLLAIDYSPVSSDLVALSKELCTPDASPLCLHVWDKALPSVPDTQFDEQVERAKLRETHRMREFLQTNDLRSADARIDLGKPGRTILEYASEHEADLIVVGAHSRHGVEHLLGTVADRVLRHADSAVLLVPKA